MIGMATPINWCGSIVILISFALLKINYLFSIGKIDCKSSANGSDLRKFIVYSFHHLPPFNKHLNLPAPVDSFPCPISLITCSIRWFADTIYTWVTVRA